MRRLFILIPAFVFALSGCTSTAVSPKYIPTGNLSYDNLMREMPVRLTVQDQRREKIFMHIFFGTKIADSGGNYGVRHWKMATSPSEVTALALKEVMEPYGYTLTPDATIVIDIKLRKFLFFENRETPNNFTAAIELDTVVHDPNQIFAKKLFTQTIDRPFDLWNFQEQPGNMLELCLSKIVEKVASDIDITNGIKKAYGKEIVIEKTQQISRPEVVGQETKENEKIGSTPIDTRKKEKVARQPVVSQGTGFLFAESGLVATNYHVVSKGEDVRVYFPTANLEFNANVELKDISNDLVVLRLKDFSYEEVFSQEIPYSIRKSDIVQIGEKVFTLGFPLGEILGKSAKFSDGTISSLTGLLGTANMFQINNPIQPGNSGGPLFDQHGNIIGIVLATLDAKFFYEHLDTIPQNVNFAIKSDYLISVISLLPESDSILSRKGSLQDKAQEEQVKALMPYITTICVR
jgi:S1-C subfamily serine protease